MAILATKPVIAKPGYLFRTRLPYSEVCMSLGVAGEVRWAELTHDGRSVQLFNESDPDTEHFTGFSAPILPGEAGLRPTAGGGGWQRDPEPVR